VELLQKNRQRKKSRGLQKSIRQNRHIQGLGALPSEETAPRETEVGENSGDETVATVFLAGVRGKGSERLQNGVWATRSGDRSLNDLGAKLTNHVNKNRWRGSNKRQTVGMESLSNEGGGGKNVVFLKLGGVEPAAPQNQETGGHVWRFSTVCHRNYNSRAATGLLDKGFGEPERKLLEIFVEKKTSFRGPLGRTNTHQEGRGGSVKLPIEAVVFVDMGVRGQGGLKKIHQRKAGGKAAIARPLLVFWAPKESERHVPRVP